MRHLLAAAAILAAFVMPAQADVVLTLSPVIGNTAGPQSISAPCIICATQAQNPANFGFNNFVNNGSTSSFNLFSSNLTGAFGDGVQGTPYTAGQLGAFANQLDLNLDIIIDVNTTGAGSEILNSFQVLNLTQGTVLAHFNGPAAIGQLANNGNGFGDWRLSGLTLAGINPGDNIIFHANWSGAVDGGESFWIQPSIAAVPGPEMGSGLVGILAGCVGMWWMQRRRREKSA